MKEDYKIFSDSDIDKVNQMNICEVAKLYGYEVRDKSSKIAEIRYQGGLSIDKQRNRWFRHSVGDGGGPIQFLMNLEGKEWKEAVASLLNRDIPIITPRLKMNEYEDKSLKLPDKNTTYKHVFAYLVKTRKIHPEIVQEFVDKKLIYENNKKSCVFIGQDKDGNFKYASIRSTNTIGTAFRGEAYNSDKRFGFARVGSNDTLTIVEAPIDLLSYMSIYKNHGLMDKIKNDHILSLGGVCETALEQYIKDNPEIKKIKLGLDNDEVGNKACIDIYNKYKDSHIVERIRIKEKDFNEVLINDINRTCAIRELERVKKLKEMDMEPELV